MKNLLVGLSIAVSVFLSGCATQTVETERFTLPRQVVRMLSTPYASCSGVVLEDSLVLTAKHCEGLFSEDKILKISDVADLMLVRELEDCPCIHLGHRPEVDDPIIIVGFPYGSLLGVSYVTHGRVQGYTEIEGEKYMALDAPLAPGNSGGAVLAKQHGEWVLVGIAVAGAGIGGPTHLALSVDYNDLKDFLKDYLKDEQK